MSVSAADVVEVVQEVWSALLSMEATVVEQPPHGTRVKVASDQTDAMVLIEGRWCSEVHVVCSKAVAVSLATAMLGVPAGEVDDAGACDALGELANIIGGNLKSMLVPPNLLSVPVVTKQRQLGTPLAETGSPQVTEVHFSSPAGAFLVSLVADPLSGAG